MTRIITVGGRKGGVGKSTVAVHLAWWLADQGDRVMLVDLDPQANATTSLGEKPGESGIWRALVQRAPVDDLVTQVKGLWLLQGGEDAADARDFLAVLGLRDGRRAMFALADALRAAQGWDFIICDCPPSYDWLSIGAVAAATELLLPASCQFLGFEGVRQFVGMVAELAESGGRAEVRHIVPTFYRSNVKMSQDIVAALTATFPGKVTPTIRESTVVDKATRHGQTVFEYSPSSAVADDFAQVARAVLNG